MSIDKARINSLARIHLYLSGIIKEQPDRIKEIEKFLHERSTKKTITKKEKVTFDIFSFLAEKGDENLKVKLNKMTLKELRKLVTFHGFYDSKTIQKWKKERLIQTIVDGAVLRTRKGSAFMQDSLDSSGVDLSKMTDETKSIETQKSKESLKPEEKQQDEGEKDV